MGRAGNPGGRRCTIRRMRTQPVMTAVLLAALLALPAIGDAAPARGAARPLVAKGGAKAAAHAVLPWIEDDFTRALAEAKTRKLPIFVESWAPW